MTRNGAEMYTYVLAFIKGVLKKKNKKKIHSWLMSL